MTSVAGSSVTSAFIDLATYDTIEKHLYGGDSAVAYFVRETKKCTWFSKLPVLLTRCSGSPNFDQEFSVNVSRGGDYVINAWMTVRIPAVKLKNNNRMNANGTIRWCKNLFHNLVKQTSVQFNDLVAQKFESYFLDFWSAFGMCGSKRVGYDNMIGNTLDMTQPVDSNGLLPEKVLVLPLPYFFSRDSGVALPSAALPYNEIRLTFHLRDWTELLIFQNKNDSTIMPLTAGDLEWGKPDLKDVQVWITNVVVTNEERRLMGTVPRDILVEQVQTAPKHVFQPLTIPSPNYDIRFSHAIKILFFGVRNVTHQAVQSNYTSSSPVIFDGGIASDLPGIAADPISDVTLVYENSSRLNEMGSEYYSLIQPYYFGGSIPVETGYHMYCYSLNMMDVDPMGSTNYGRLSNVSIKLKTSPKAITTAGGNGANTSGYKDSQKFEFLTMAVNHNVIRIKNGSMGFPVL
ncbi:major capsid protein [Lymphocystis disease virus 3]|uniref:Major capsid protein n=13 Tax=Lymphocystivirus TaxID=10494 RepID=A0A1B2RVY7_9VIRU|nr:major capsid protein [Lymphocystis disease virus Sa]AOC55146.1 major capsid protein [Lymphocystis disease virus 3]